MTGKRDENPEASGIADWARFFATWIRHPVKMGAIAPSSPSYCAMMVEKATVGIEGPILEIGPGLGVVTRALLDKGIAPERITSIEYDAAFARTLQQRFPQVNVIHGDGFDLDATLGAAARQRFAAILFAVPILHLAEEERRRLFCDYVARLRPGGNLTQLSYALTAPVKPVPGVFQVSSSPIVWRNIPPARVWIYTPDPARRAAEGPQ